MSSIPAIESREDTLTKEYRLRASLLAATTLQATSQRNDLPMDVQLEMPVRLIINSLMSHHPGWISGNAVSDQTNDSSPSFDASKLSTTCKLQNTNGETDIIFPCCRHCGGPLDLAGKETNIQLVSVKKMSRTQRRRLSRQMARLQKSEKKHGNRATTKALSNLGKYTNSTFSGAKQETSAGDSLLLERAEEMYRLSLQRCKTHVAIQCPCRFKTLFPGTPNKHARPRAAKKLPLLKKTKAEGKAVASISRASKKMKTDNQEDFITLSPSPSARPRGPKAKKKRIPDGLSSNKGKSRSRDSKNRLMDFLSSLND